MNMKFSIDRSLLFRPPPPPPRCDCACAHAAPVYAAPAQSYAPQSVYYAPAAVQQPQPLQQVQQAAYEPRASSASDAYDAAIDNTVLDTLGGAVAGAPATYEGPARGGEMPLICSKQLPQTNIFKKMKQRCDLQPMLLDLSSSTLLLPLLMVFLNYKKIHS